MRGKLSVKYLKVQWIHNFDDEPVMLYSEIDINRNEVRKIEIYKDGTVGYADKVSEYNGSLLSELPMPTLREIASDSQFRPKEILKHEFEEMWTKALSERVK